MKTILLLAGRSTRLWPLTDKTLFPVCGKTLLEHQIAQLKEGGCDDIILVGGSHNLEDIKSRFPSLKTVEQEDLSLGMRGALLSALPECGKEPVCIVSGNDVIDHAAYSLIREMSSSVTGGAILAKEVSTYFPGGYLTVEGNRVTGIVEKPGEGNEPSNLINIVAHIHNDSSVLLAALKEVSPKKDDGYEQALATLLKDYEYVAVPYEGDWKAVKYPWHFLPLLELFLSEITEPVIDPSADIHPTAVIDGPVIIGPSVKVLPHATVKGPCFVGANSIIANNALVRNASIGENCVVGYNTEVKSSILAGHVWTHMTYIGDSIVGENVSFGGGCVTGNLRLDERTIQSNVKKKTIDSALTKFGTIIGDNVRIGIQVGINPGVKIGGESFIAGGVFVPEDIPSGSFVYSKNGTVQIKENKETVPRPNDRAKYKKSM